MSHTCETQLYLLGTLWEVEIEFSYDPADPDVGLAAVSYTHLTLQTKA